MGENAAGMAERMKGAEKPLQTELLRGGPLGSSDRLTSGEGGPLDALMEVARGRNTGASQYVRVPVSTVLPNVGSQYAGTAPYSPPDAAKALLDFLGIATTSGGQ